MWIPFTIPSSGGSSTLWKREKRSNLAKGTLEAFFNWLLVLYFYGTYFNLNYCLWPNLQVHHLLSQGRAALYGSWQADRRGIQLRNISLCIRHRILMCVLAGKIPDCLLLSSNLNCDLLIFVFNVRIFDLRFYLLFFQPVCCFHLQGVGPQEYTLIKMKIVEPYTGKFKSKVFYSRWHWALITFKQKPYPSGPFNLFAIVRKQTTNQKLKHLPHVDDGLPLAAWKAKASTWWLPLWDQRPCLARPTVGWDQTWSMLPLKQPAETFSSPPVVLPETCLTRASPKRTEWCQWLWKYSDRYWLCIYCTFIHADDIRNATNVAV